MKKILLSATALFAVASLNAQILNGNLDAWTSGEPDSWLYDLGAGIGPGTYNFVTSFGQGDPATTTEITGAGAAGGSGSSALLTTQDMVGAIVLGQGITKLPGILVSEWSYTGNPTTLSFDYQVQPMAGDTAIIQMTLYDGAGVDVAYTAVVFTTADATGTWTPMNLPVFYYGVGTVASIEIWAQSSYSEDDSEVTGSTLSVDNFAVSGSAAGIEEFELTASVYPNPTSDVLNFKLNDDATSITIIGLDGKVFSTTTVNANTTTIDVSSLTSGMYVYQIATANGEVIRETFVKQ